MQECETIDKKQIKKLENEIRDLKLKITAQKGAYDKEMRQAYADVEYQFNMVSHELLTFIREIDLYAKFIQEDSAELLMEESAEDLQSIRHTCEKITEMVRSFMDYSRADKKTLNKQVIQMEPLIRECFSHVLHSAPSHQIELVIQELPDIIGDIALIRQVVCNLLSNSIKFTRDIANARISIDSYEEADMVNLCFQDNGTGFDMKYASNVFNIFGRLHNENEFEGYGIGLATVKRIVERFEGHVEIFSMLNKGCSVTIKLPKHMVIPLDSSQKKSEQKKSKVLIGIIGILNGEYSVITPCRKYAYELAAEEINASGGIAGKKIELIFKDCQSDVALAAEQAWELIELEHVDVLIGGVLSSAREEIRKIADQTKTLYFFDCLYEGGVADHYTFCTSAVPEQNLYPMIDYLMEKYGKQFYIITADYNYGILSAESAKHYIEKQGGQIVAVEYFQVSKSNFEVTIENIKEAMPDVLLSFCIGKRQNHFYKQWHEKGAKGIPMISTIGLGLSYLHKIYEPPVMDDIYFMSSYIEELQTETAREFNRKIRNRHPKGSIPYIEFDAESAYTSIYLYSKAAELAGTMETESVIKVLESGDVFFDGPGGRVTVRGEDHHVVRDLRLFRSNRKHEIEEISQFTGLYSDFVEQVIEESTGIKGGLRTCGLNSPNIQYNLMFHKIRL